MAIPCRILPQMAILIAFNAAVRHQSFTAAASELNLSKSAIGRQIRSLDELLGSELLASER